MARVRKRAVLVGVVGVLLVLAGMLVAYRHRVLASLLPLVISSATGYDVTIGEERIGTRHAALLHVRVARGGEPVLEARRIDLWYSVRDLLPGSTHRFGVNAIAIDHPSLTLVRHKDGSYNIAMPQSGPAPAAAPRLPNRVPIHLTVRIRNGVGALRAPYALDPASRTIDVKNLSLDASIDTSARTHYVLQGAFVESALEPFAAIGTIDVARGYAMHHAYAANVPMRAIANYFINSDAAQILGGTARNLDIRAYSLDVRPHAAIVYHLGGSLDVQNGAMHIVGLAAPLARISGRLQIVDNDFFSTRLHATLLAVPVLVSGGIYDFAHAQYRLGIATRADLARLRGVFAFARAEPISGEARVAVVVQGALNDPTVLAHVDARRAVYRTVPLDDLQASLAYHHATLFLAPVRAHVDRASVTLRGTIAVGDAIASHLALHAQGPAAAFPYAGELLGDEPLVADVTLKGLGMNFAGSGALESVRGPDRVVAGLRLDRDGIVNIAPLWTDTPRGRIAGAYYLNRRTDESAFWLHASHLALALAAPSHAFDGLLPALPPLRGRIDDLALEGGGASGLDALVAGSVDAHTLDIAGVQLDALHGRFIGTLADAAVDPLHARGPWGAFDGKGALSLDAIAMSGAYHGSLQGLRPYLADPSATGDVSGTASLAIEPGRVTVQADDLSFRDARIHGLPVQRMRGTLATENGTVHVYAAQGSLAGGAVVAAGRYDRGIALVASHVNGAALRAIGLPLDAGSISANATISANAAIPDFHGGVAIANGRVQSYRVAGSGDVALSDGRAQLHHVVGALDGTYALLSGDITGFASGGPAYSLSARIPAGDVTRALHTLSLRTFASDGTYDASFDVTGRGLDPHVRGPVDIGAGSVNGLPFIDGHALLDASRTGVIARHGGVQVGSTHVTFAAGENPRISGVLIRMPHAQLADFNNFFDTGDTLAGAGSVRFDVISQAHRISSNGDVNVSGLRYRNLPIGDTRANWSSAHNRLAGSLYVGGDQGRLRAHGAITFAPSPQWIRVLENSSYRVSLDLDHLDSSMWLAAAGFPEVPVTGKLDGDATVVGRYPRLQAHGSASLRGGTIWRLPIDEADLAFSTVGKRVRVDSGSLVARGLTATASGSLGFAASDPLGVDVYLNSDDVPRLMTQLVRTTIPVQGQFESTVSFRGTPAKPQISAAFDASDAMIYGVKIPSIFGSLVWDRAHNAVVLRNAGAQFEHGEVTLAGSLPLRLQPFGIGPENAPVSFDLAVNALDPGAFDALLGHGTHVGGTVDGALAIGGIVKDPRIYGRFDIDNGRYVSDFDRTPITNIGATLQFDRTQATVGKLFANLGRGSVNASGHVRFGRQTSFRVAATASNAQLDVPQFGVGAIDGAVVLDKLTNSNAKLSGDLTLHDATIPFSAFLVATGTQNHSAGALPRLNLGFRLGMAAGKNVRVRGAGYGAGLDIGAVGSVLLAGSLANPTLDGAFTSTSGTLTYFDRAFRVQNALVAFDPSLGVIPTLHATGITHVSNPDPRAGVTSADVTISVDGPINGLNVAFSTNPPGYSNEQILAMIAPFSSLVGGVAFAPSYSNQSINGVTPYGALNPVPGAQSIGPTATGTIGQEAFNLLNAQFTAGVLAPFESALSAGLGVQDINVNVDYYGNVGFSVTRLLGKTVDFIYSQSFGIPARYSAGLQLIGGRNTSAQLSFYWTSGPQRLFETPSGTFASTSRVIVGQPLQGQSGFSFTLQRLYW